MKYRDKPELQEKLAAEFVLGTLRGRARLRFQTWLRNDARLRGIVSEWERRLAPLAAGVDEVRPPQRVWRSIESRIADGGSARPRGGFWESTAFWRGWGLVATGCAAALVAALALQQPQRIEVPVVQTVETPAQVAMQPAYVAILYAKEEGEKLVFMAYAARKSNELWVRRVDLQKPPTGRDYELWGIPSKPGERPQSLGMIPAAAKATLKLPGAADETLENFSVLVISIEPIGGSKTGSPSGQVVAKGDCFKFW